MPDFGIYAGDTNKTVYIRLRDATTGLGKTGLVFNSAGAVCSYTLPLAARAAITLATQTVTGAHTDGGFVEVDATNCKGLYRLDLPDAAIASGDFTVISIEFDGIIEESMTIPLHAELQTLVTRVPNTLNTTASGNIGIDWANVENPTTAVDLSATDIQLCDTITTYTGNTLQTGDSFARIGAAGAGLTGVVWNSAWDTEVESEVNDALVVFFTSSVQLVDDIWDELLFWHTTPDSAAVALKDIVADTSTTLSAQITTIASDVVQIYSDTTIIASDIIIAVSDTAAIESELIIVHSETTIIASDVIVITADVAAIGVSTGTGLNFEIEADNTGGAIKSITFVGVQTSGTFASTEAEDGTMHVIDDTGNAIDIVYQADVGAIRRGVQAVWKGYVNGSNDTVNVQAYDFVGTDWETVAAIGGQAGTDNITTTISLLQKHTGTGADVGIVLLRFICSAQSNPTLNTDSLLVEGAIANQSVGYALGAIWIDTGASNTNTASFVDGVADNPVSTWAAALTLSGALGINKFQIAAGSSIALSGNSDNYVLNGANWTLALGTQSIDGLYVTGATTITGTGEATTTQPTFIDCLFGAATVPPAVLIRCGIGLASGTFTAAIDAGEYVFEDCYSAVPGSGSPVFNFDPVNASTGINNRRWSGGATYTLDSNCALSHDALIGGGTTITTGGADVEVRGMIRALTVTMSAAETVQFVGVTGPITLSGTTTGTVNLFGVSSSLSDTTSAATVTDNTSLNTQLTTVASDAVLIYSDTTAIEAAGGGLTAAQASDLVAIESELALVHSETTIIASDAIVLTTDIASLSSKQDSDMVILATATTAIDSELVLVHSETTALQSQMTTVASDVVQIYSDTTIIASDAVVLTADVASLSTKQDSDMVVVATATTAIDSELVLVHSETTALQVQATTIASDIIQIYSDTTIIASDAVVITTDIAALSTKQDSDMVIVATATTAIDSELVLVHSETTALQTQATTIASDLVIAASDIVQIYSDTTVISSDTAKIEADLPGRVTKNVALANFPFLMVLSSDNTTPATGLTVTATRSLDGAAFAACANAVTEVASGWYKISLAAADLNGDTIALRFTAATASDRNITIVTQP